MDEDVEHALRALLVSLVPVGLVLTGALFAYRAYKYFKGRKK